MWCGFQSTDNISLRGFSHINGKVVGKSERTTQSARIMAQKPPENSDTGEPFPTNDFWEELVDEWEDFHDDDPLGSDHERRFEAIALGIRSGALPPDAASAIVSRGQVATVVAPLELGDTESLVDQLRALAGRHLRPRHRKLLGSDPKATRQQLATLIKAVNAMEKALDCLPPVTIDFLQKCHRRLPASYRTRASIDLADLDLTLSDIGHSAFFADLTLIRERRQPPKLLRARTLARAVDIIEAAASGRIEHSWSLKDEKHYAFHGTEGRVLRAFMQLIEPGASERVLVQDLMSVRRQAEANTI